MSKYFSCSKHVEFVSYGFTAKSTRLVKLMGYQMILAVYLISNSGSRSVTFNICDGNSPVWIFNLSDIMIFIQKS